MAFQGTNAALAWVHHNSSNTIADSFGISSVSRYGTGNYQIFFSVACPNDNYVAVGGASSNKDSNGVYMLDAWPDATTSYYTYTHWTNGTAYDLSHNFSIVFGDKN